MGGLISSLISRGAQAAGRGLEEGILKTEGSAAGRELNAFMGNQEWELNATPEGKLIKGYISEGHRVELPILHELDKPRKLLWEGIKADPVLAKHFDYENTSLSDIHAHLQSTGHPLAQHSSQLLQQNATTLQGNTVLKNADKTLRELSFQNNRQASLLAVEKSMGKNMENVLPLIGRLRDSNVPVERELAQRYADIISNEFRDREGMTGFAKDGTVKGAESRTKATMNKAFGMVNKFRQQEGLEGIPLLDTKPTYTDQGVIERHVTNILRTTQVPLAVLPHSSMEFNLAMAAPTKALIKALIGSDKAASERAIESSHILAIQDLEALQNDIAARSGKIAKWTSSPTLGSILNKGFHMPGFNALRSMQMRHAGAVGFQTALHWADKLMKGSTQAVEELAQLGIDHNAVRAQGGQLTEEQLSKAVFHFADDTMFLKKGLNMPLKSNANWFMRSMYMYHFFVRNETFFMQKQLGKMLRHGDMAGVARFVGTLAVLWPAVAPLLESVEVLGRTGSVKQAEEPWKQMYAPKSGTEWAENYGLTIAQIGAMGTFAQYLRAVKNQSVWKYAVGSKISTPLTYLGDASSALRGGSAKPIERDLLQLIPVAGKPLSHQLAPTAKEEPKYSRHPLHKGRRKRQ